MGVLTEGDVVEVEDFYYAGDFAKIKNTAAARPTWPAIISKRK